MSTATPLHSPQALSNSIWAVAHARSKLANFDAVCGPPGAVSAFLVAIAISANTMLKALYTRLDLAHLSAFLNNVEHKFSCQVGVPYAGDGGGPALRHSAARRFNLERVLGA